MVEMNDSKTEKLIENMTEYFANIPTYKGLDNKLKFLNEKLEGVKTVFTDLNKNIKEANESSEKLTKVLNKITLAGVIVGVLALVVATGNLIFEIYKYSNR